MTSSASELKDRIISLYSKLEAATSLAPSATINQTFTELVQLSSEASTQDAADVLQDQTIQELVPHLRELCSEGESQLEAYWAHKIIADNHPSVTLETFPYYDNYLKLSELEYQSLKLIDNRTVHRALFVGSGPLPLSSILLAQKYGLTVDNLDNDRDAISLSKELIGRLGLSDVVTVTQADAATFKQYAQYDVIFLASLVGLNPEQKQAIIATIQKQMKEGAILVVRTAHGLRTLLYPPVSTDLISGLSPQVIIQPLNEVVNSVIVLEKPYDAIREQLVVDDKSEPLTTSRFRQFCMEMIAEMYHYTYNPTWHFDIDRADDIYRQDRSSLFIVRYGEEVLGTAAIRPYDRDYETFAGQYGEQTGSIWRFLVRPQYRNLGLEQLLQEQVEAFARSAGFTTLYAHDQRDVPGALQKYINNGYRVTHESNDTFGTVHFEKQLEA